VLNHRNSSTAFIDKIQVEIFRQLRTSGTGKSRPVPVRSISIQSKLRNNKKPAADILQRQIRLPVLIRKNPERVFGRLEVPQWKLRISAVEDKK